MVNKLFVRFELEKRPKKNDILSFLKELCNEIRMKPIGKPHIVKGHKNTPLGTGYTICQIIETSHMIVHQSNKLKTIDIDIYSCKHFSTKKVNLLAKIYFKPCKFKKSIIDNV